LLATRRATCRAWLISKLFICWLLNLFQHFNLRCLTSSSTGRACWKTLRCRRRCLCRRVCLIFQAPRLNYRVNIVKKPA
jgi:hypothetical protein